MKCRFDAVFFDFDGTFADTGKGIYRSVDYAADALGKERLSDSEKRYFIGPPVFDSFMKMLNLTRSEAAFAVEKYRECYALGAMYDLDVYPGIIELLEELNKAEIPVAICSSKPAKFINAILKNLKAENLIDMVSCLEADGMTKTKREMIDDAAAHFGIGKDRILMVGDRKFDIEGAKEAGVHSCGAAYGYGSIEELTKAGAETIVSDVTELKNLIF